MGSPTVLEAQIPEYRWGSRVSIYTGLPTILGLELASATATRGLRLDGRNTGTGRKDHLREHRPSQVMEMLRQVRREPDVRRRPGEGLLFTERASPSSTPWSGTGSQSCISANGVTIYEVEHEGSPSRLEGDREV